MVQELAEMKEQRDEFVRRIDEKREEGDVLAPWTKTLQLTFKGPLKHRTISGDAVKKMSSGCLYTDDHERFLKNPPRGTDGRCSACLHRLGVTEVNGYIM